MSNFDKEKLNIIYNDDIDNNGPVIPRRYTLTHSDETGELYLSIGRCYDYSKVGKLRDEVLGRWSCDDNGYILIFEVFLDMLEDEEKTAKRDKIFRDHLPMAIKSIVYGDMELFEAHESLYECKVFIKFKSKYHKYNVKEQWGCVKDYKIDNCDFCRMETGKFNPGIPFEKFVPMNPGNSNNNNTNLINYPGPFPKGPQYPYNYGNKGNKKKSDVIERALMEMLYSYIENSVFLTFGKNTPFCLDEGEILDARVVATYGPCRQRYEVVVGVRAGKRTPPYNNLIITFEIDNKKVTVKSIKNPRNGE